MADGEGKCGESGGAARQRDEKKDWATELGRRGTLGYIVSLMPDTSGIRELAQIIPKCVFSLPIPFSVISQSKKVYNLDPNRVSSLSLSNAMK